MNPGTERIEELDRTRQRREAGDHFLDFRKRDSVAIENGQSLPHELVVIRLITRGPAEFRQTGAFSNCNPDLRSEDAFHIEGDNTLFHRGGMNPAVYRKGKPWLFN